MTSRESCVRCAATFDQKRYIFFPTKCLTVMEPSGDLHLAFANTVVLLRESCVCELKQERL